ncbi:hypothetical protein IAU59_000104 [Kwoniella sp. CBS 9459]
MPTDPIAYMSGMIPSVSRGGSWVPGQFQVQGFSSYGSPTSTATIPSSYSAPGSVSRASSAHSSPASPVLLTPPGPGPGPAFATGPKMHPRVGFVNGSVDEMGRRTSASVNGGAPVSHHGWLRNGSEGGGVSIEGDGNNDGSGSPVAPVGYSRSRYRSKQHSFPAAADSRYLGTSETSSSSPSPSPYRKLSEREIPHHERHGPDTPSSSSSLGANQTRPGLARRHTHSPVVLAPKPRKGLEVDLQRSAQVNCRMARLSLHGPNCHTPDPASSPSPLHGSGSGSRSGSPPSLSSPLRPNEWNGSAHHGQSGSRHSVSSSSGASGNGGRLSIERRHSSGFSHTKEAPSAPSSLPHSHSHRHQNSNHSHADHRLAHQAERQRVRHASTPGPSALVPLPSPSSFPKDRRHHQPDILSPRKNGQTSPSARSANSRWSKPDFPTPTTKPFPRSHMGSVYNRSRDPDWESSGSGSGFGSRSRSGSFSHSPSPRVSQEYSASSHGYVPPLSHIEYDRYEAHPAPPPGPDSNTFYAHSTPHSHTGSASGSTSPTGHTPPPPKEYIPPAFPKPTRDVKWNRTGPAMKTHGIAWLREGEVGELPHAPKGPRYIVARPPRAERISGGNWWSSGS